MNAGRYKLKKERALRRRMRVRRRVRGGPERPRLTVSRSLRHLYAQVVDDASGRTLLGMSSRIVTPEMIAAALEAKAEKKADAKGAKDEKKTDKRAEAKGERQPDKKAVSRTLGLQVAARAKELGIESVVFDRDRYPYHGRIQQFADGARKGGLKF